MFGYLRYFSYIYNVNKNKGYELRIDKLVE